MAIYGKTTGGAPITGDLVNKLAKRAEVGYDVEETLRPPPGPTAAGVGARDGGVDPVGT